MVSLPDVGASAVHPVAAVHVGVDVLSAKMVGPVADSLDGATVRLGYCSACWLIRWQGSAVRDGQETGQKDAEAFHHHDSAEVRGGRITTERLGLG